NYDYSTQTVRGSLFFEYLTNSSTFKYHLRKYLNWHRVENGDEYLYNIIMLITLALPGWGHLQKSHIINTGPDRDKINHRLLSRISINSNLIHYVVSEDFTGLRKFPIYKGLNNQYLILDMPFLYDKLFKNVVFTFKDHLKENNFTENFLSIKGKEFSEEILFYNVILRCFNKHTYHLYSGKMTEPVCKGELCDYYIRSNNRIALMEFKDVLLDTSSKNDGTTKVLFQKMDLKFSINQNKSPKGVRQLAKAIEKLSNGISFDTLDSEDTIIYPIICYTDSSFGFDGINRRYDKMFQDFLTSTSVSKKFIINPLVFINLDFFQHFEDFLYNETIDFFGLIDRYYEHIKIPGHEIVPFEIFVGSYMNDMGKPTEISKLGKERLYEIMKGR
ncbi:MAG TPA: hypothetical protein VK809_00580, partial [Bacteroidia bacterium]|nr:hypothetical protein [Bacteroidia bacterium]